MKQVSFLLVLMFLLTACGAAPTPAAATPDVQATISAYSGTMVAATLTAQPTNTLVPTNTALPTGTPTPTETVTPEILIPTATQTAFVGSFVPGNTEGLPTGLIRVENYTGQELVFTMDGVTKTRSVPVYVSWKINGVYMFSIPWGTYNYRIVIGDKRTLTGIVGIANKDKTTFKVYNNKVAILGP
ncbi:MAG: hypothetical protein NT121_00515 [Chloroflexi bacterium]|nr:hypothetical protein [Chloroflexota bacterium]